MANGIPRFDDSQFTGEGIGAVLIPLVDVTVSSLGGRGPYRVGHGPQIIPVTDAVVPRISPPGMVTQQSSQYPPALVFRPLPELPDGR